MNSKSQVPWHTKKVLDLFWEEVLSCASSSATALVGGVDEPWSYLNLSYEKNCGNHNNNDDDDDGNDSNNIFSSA